MFQCPKTLVCVTGHQDAAHHVLHKKGARSEGGESETGAPARRAADAEARAGDSQGQAEGQPRHVAGGAVQQRHRHGTQHGHQHIEAAAAADSGVRGRARWRVAGLSEPP